MFYMPFWTFVFGTVILAVIAAIIRKADFIDMQVMIMSIAVAMSCDMILCKQFKLYHYVDMSMKNIGWYSFWLNILVVPAIAFIFIKFLPAKKKNLTIYILIWTLCLTVFEICVLKPSGILHTPRWQTIPWSLISYFLALSLEYFYFSLLKQMIPTPHLKS